MERGNRVEKFVQLKTIAGNLNIDFERQSESIEQAR